MYGLSIQQSYYNSASFCHLCIRLFRLDRHVVLGKSWMMKDGPLGLSKCCKVDYCIVWTPHFRGVYTINSMDGYRLNKHGLSTDRSLGISCVLVHSKRSWTAKHMSSTASELTSLVMCWGSTAVRTSIGCCTAGLVLIFSTVKVVYCFEASGGAVLLVMCCYSACLHSWLLGCELQQWLRLKIV